MYPDDDYDLRAEARDDEPDWREEEFAARWTVGADGAGEENEA